MSILRRVPTGIWIICLTLALLVCFAAVSRGDDSAAAAPASGETMSADAADDTPASAQNSQRSLQDVFNQALEPVNTFVENILFFDVTFGAFRKEVTEEIKDEATGQTLRDTAGNPVTRIKLGEDDKPVMDGPTVPFMVIFLAVGAVFFTLYHRFINIRGFRHAVQIVRGKYSSADDLGDISPFRALTSALSATVGLGNIAGVAIALNTGGPGAIFWMMLLGIFGMTAKYHESTLAQLFRQKNKDGTVSGGPMYYLDRGLPQIHPSLLIPGKTLAVIFAVFCIGASFGGGNMFQSNQAFEGFYASFVQPQSLEERYRDRDLSATELRSLLTEKQLEASRKYLRLPESTDLEEVRQQLPDNRVRWIVTPEQVRNHVISRAETDSEKLLLAEAFADDAAARAEQRHTVGMGFGMVMACVVGVVVIGGITRIGATTSRIVPAMCGLYVFGCLVVIFFNIDQVPSHVAEVFHGAFAWEPMYGGLIGVLVIGFTRAAFSSEAGLGSSAIAHSAAKTNEPVREGLVASLEPFIDTIIICFMTAMVVLITDAYMAPQFVVDDDPKGSAITLFAFSETRLGDWFPYVLSISIILFAFSTMIAWCYYGERAWGYLFGLRTVIIYRIAFVFFVFVGAVASLEQVLEFADLMLLSMAFPNIIGGIILAKLVHKHTQDYWNRYRSGEMQKTPVAADRYEI